MSDKTLISFDYAIKLLLKNKGDYDIVEGFISAILSAKGYPPVKIKSLLESESNKEEKEMKRSIADLIVEDINGNKYIVEIDRSYTNLFLHKACFNSSRLIIDSISSSEDYSTISKIIHINLLYFPFGNKNTPMHHGKTIFHEIDTHEPQNIHLEDLGNRTFDAYNIFPEYFVISVPLFNDVIKSEMDEWLYMMKHSEVKSDFKSPYMSKVAKRLNILTMNPAEREKYLAYRNLTLKERDYVVAAEEKGKAKGKTERNTEIAKNALKNQLDIKTISAITGLSEAEIHKLKKEI